MKGKNVSLDLYLVHDKKNSTKYFTTQNTIHRIEILHFILGVLISTNRKLISTKITIFPRPFNCIFVFINNVCEIIFKIWVIFNFDNMLDIN